MSKKNKKQYQIFCDLDGVLVDLLGGVNDALYATPDLSRSTRHRKIQAEAQQALGYLPLKQENLNKNSEYFLKPVREFMYRVARDDRKFWRNLNWLDGGTELWSFIKKYDPIILSRPTDLQAVIGKKNWVKDNLGLKGDRVQIRYDKTPYAKYEGKIGVLIDDFYKNTEAFRSAGGESILYKNTNQAIESLKALGFTG